MSAVQQQRKTPPESRQFLYTEDNGVERKLHLVEDVLRSFLETGDVADKPVVVISVAGAFRTGKSFLLNSMTRFVTAPDRSRWLDNKLVSFQWSSGSKSHTNGMIMSPPIPVTLQSGEDAVLILLDTQGLFDDDSSVADATKIFALSTLFSSMQVFNLKGNLKSDDLDHLQLFAEIGSLAKEHSNMSPFQDLLFLIRDWNHTDDHSFGSVGGDALVQNRLKSDKKELTQRRQHIEASFAKIGGFLMPEPGKAVARSSTFADEDMDPEFVAVLEDLLSTLLSPERLVVKRNGNRPMTCKELAKIIKVYTDLFKTGKLPEPKGIFQTVAESCNTAAVDAELDTYVKKMNELLAEDAPLLHEDIFKDKHQLEKSKVLQSLKKREIMRDPTKSEDHYCSLLTGKIEEWFEKSQNTFKLRCVHDEQKVREQNDKLASECIKSFKAAMLCLESQTPIGEVQIRETYNAAQQEAMERFTQELVTLGSYIPTAIRDSLRETLEEHLAVVLARDEEMSNERAVQLQLQGYQVNMESILDETAPNMDEGQVSNKHQAAMTEALQMLQPALVNKHSTKTGNDFSLRLEDEIKKWYEASQNRYREKCKSSKRKADEKNSALVNACTDSFVTLMHALKGTQPVDKTRILKHFDKTKEKVTQAFESEKIVFGSYNAEEYRKQLEKGIQTELNKILRREEDNANSAIVRTVLVGYKNSMRRLLHDDRLTSTIVERKHEQLKKNALDELKATLRVEHSTQSKSDHLIQLQDDANQWFDKSKYLFAEKCAANRMAVRTENKKLAVEKLETFFSSVKEKLTVVSKTDLDTTCRDESKKTLKNFREAKLTLSDYAADDVVERLETVLHMLQLEMVIFEKECRSALGRKIAGIVGVTLGSIATIAAGPVGWLAGGIAGASAAAAAAGAGITSIVIGAIGISDSDSPEEVRIKTFTYLMDERDINSQKCSEAVKLLFKPSPKK